MKQTSPFSNCRFLARIAMHPLLKDSEPFLVFLRESPTAFAVCKQSELKESLLAKMTTMISGLRLKQPDGHFMTNTENIKNLHEGCGEVILCFILQYEEVYERILNKFLLRSKSTREHWGMLQWMKQVTGVKSLQYLPVSVDKRIQLYRYIFVSIKRFRSKKLTLYFI